ncbi:hypothetical protein N7493_005764 [Penicillium malachiteum]|uniref:Carrier domain-containing protein n=1 Tax=Penicillium malachiteum TaxID=1324776 RepID=A0AAD6HN87_9EURO|nr:hypothetical protein N7493_005764 [Penicillium malachiteum]
MRTFYDAVDQLAAEQPDGLFAKIETQLGIPAENETMAYMGIGDIRYPIVTIAAMKMGYKILLTSPRNSEDAQISLLQSISCKKFLHTSEFAAQMQAFSVRHSELRPVEIPGLDEMTRHDHTLKPTYSPPRPRKEDVALILHSSGSTGLPKPIFIRAEALATCETITSMPAPPNRINTQDLLYASTLMFSMMPFFHIMGIMTLARAIYHQGPFAILPPGKPPSADLLMTAIIQTKPSTGAFVPSVLEEICNSSNGLETLSTLDFIVYGGAPLSRSCGDKVTRVTHLQVGIGSTEMMSVPCYLTRDPADWEYFEWSAEFGVVMEPATDRSFELVIKRKADTKYQIVFQNYPELSEWRTKDLFEKHPTKPGLWRHIGRLDDWLVFSNGEKTNPAAFEKAMEGHPWVQGALVLGSGQFQAGLIIEPRPDHKATDEKAFIDEIWPLVQRANDECPAYAKVWQSMIILSDPDKPFKRADKGSVLRKMTCNLYESEISELFKGQDGSSSHEPGAIDALTDFENIKAVVRTALKTCQTSSGRISADNNDIFDGGLDSLSVLRMSKIISAACRVTSASQVCPPRLIYNNPTIEQISRALQQNITGNGHSRINPSPEVMSREEQISAMIHKYTKSLSTNPIADMPPPPASGKHTAILTGSTGFFGTYLLHSMLRSPSFERIYCFNRSADAESRQLKSLRDQGLDAGNLAEKVEFLTTDLSQAQFGLSSSKYNDLQEKVNVFFHNAWPVNFNNTLASFETAAVVGVRHCIDFAFSAKHRPNVMFPSSIASVGNWLVVRDDATVPETVPETFEDGPCLPLKQGYGEFKHVANSILSRAARKSGLRATVFRLGQLGGSLDGAGVWKKTEWFPTLIATSKSLLKILSSLGGDDTINWVPMDVAAESVIEIALSRLENSYEKSFDCFNIVNPQVVQWNDLLNPISEYYRNQGCAMETVGYADWLNSLKQIEPTAESIDKYPGIKLTDVYEDMNRVGSRELQYSTDQSVSKSSSLANLQALDDRIFEKWLNRWAFS